MTKNNNNNQNQRNEYVKHREEFAEEMHFNHNGNRNREESVEKSGRNGAEKAKNREMRSYWQCHKENNFSSCSYIFRVFPGGKSATQINEKGENDGHPNVLTALLMQALFL